MHIVAFITRIYHDARSPAPQIYEYIYIDKERYRLSGKQRFEPFMFCVKIVCESRQSNVSG